MLGLELISVFRFASHECLRDRVFLFINTVGFFLHFSFLSSSFLLFESNELKSIKRANEVADYFGVEMDIVEFDYYKRGTELTEEFSDFFRNQMATSMSCYQWLELGQHISKNYKNHAKPIFSPKTIIWTLL